MGFLLSPGVFLFQRSADHSKSLLVHLRTAPNEGDTPRFGSEAAYNRDDVTDVPFKKGARNTLHHACFF
jgi:hypothetical protein